MTAPKKINNKFNFSEISDTERDTLFGIWKWNPKKDVFIWSENLYEIYEVKPHEVNKSFETYLNFFYPEDRTEIRSMLLLALKEKKSFSFNENIVIREGKSKSIKTYISIITDKKGVPVELFGTCFFYPNGLLSKELQKSESLNKYLLEYTGNVIVLQDKDQSIIFANSTAVKAAGASNIDDLIGQKVDKFLLEQDKQELRKRFNEVLKTSSPSSPKTISFKTFKNQIRVGESQLFPFHHKGETLVLTVIKDVTDVIAIYNALLSSEEKLRYFIKHAPVSIAMLDKRMRFLSCSNQFIEDWVTTNYKPQPEEIKDKYLSKVMGDIPKRWMQSYNKALAGEIVSVEEDFIIKNNGKREWLLWEVRPWHEDKNSIGGIVLFTEFITKRKETELILQENEAKQNALLSNLPGIVFSSKNDEDRNILYLSNAFKDITGYDPTSFRKEHKNLNNLIHNNDVQKVQKKISLALEEREIYEVTYRIITQEKKIKYVLERGQGIYTPGGNVRSIEGVILDITAQKKAEREKQEIAKRNRALLKALPDLIFIMDKDGNFIDLEVNDPEMLITDKKHVLGSNIKDYFSEEQTKKLNKRIKQTIKNGESASFEYSIPVKGSYKYFEARMVNYKNNVLCLVRDITKTREAEKKIIASEEKFYKSFHLSPIPVAIVHLKSGKIIDVNEQFESLVDLKKSEIIGKNVNKMQFWKEASDKPKFMEKLLRAGRVEQFESFLKTSYGDIKNVVLSGEIIEIEKEKAALLMIFDVTARKQAENDLIDLTEELRMSNEDLRQFAYITSHNFRGPVVNLESLLEFYDKSKSSDQNNIEVISKIEQSVKQLKSTLQDLINLVAVKEHEKKKNLPVNIKDVIDSVLRSLDKPIRDTEAVIELSLEVYSLKIKKPILESIIYNLISNALKYYHIDRKPIIKVRTYRKEDQVLLEVEDNGMGIDLNKYGNKLFGLYQRLTKDREGKGLGLYIIKTQVENIGGKIDVSSKIGTGTKFLVYFTV